MLDVPECLIRLPLGHIDLGLAKDLLKSAVSLLDVELFTHLEEQTLVSALLRLVIVANRELLEAANDLDLVVELFVPVGSGFSKRWLQKDGAVG